MESMHLDFLIKLATAFGLPGLILILQYMNNKQQEKSMDAYREDTRKALVAYKEDIKEVRQMYESNVVLVKQYANTCGDLKDVIIMNTTMIQRLSDAVVSNQYCPNVRLKKDSTGVVT